MSFFSVQHILRLVSLSIYFPIRHILLTNIASTFVVVALAEFMFKFVLSIMYAFLAFDVVKRMKVIFDYPEYPGTFWCF